MVSSATVTGWGRGLKGVTILHGGGKEKGMRFWKDGKPMLFKQMSGQEEKWGPCKADSGQGCGRRNPYKSGR